MTSDPSGRHHTKHFSVPEGTLLTALLETAPDVVYFKDRESRFIAVSASLVGKHGFAGADDVIGKSDLDFFEERFARKGLDDEQRIIQTGEPLVNVLVKETWADGRVTWSLNSKTPLRNDRGEILGIVGIGKDVTKSKEMELALEKAHRDLVDASRLAGMAEVATGVLHNVGNVLNSLNVSTTVVTAGLQQLRIESLAKICALLKEHADHLGTFLAEDPKGRRVPEFLETLATQLREERSRLLLEMGSMQKNVDHIKDIVSMQQSYSTMVGVVEALDPVTLMDDALRMNSVALTRHNVRVNREYREAGPVLAERGKVLQVLVNLIRNAKYACDENSGGDRLVTLALEPDGDAVRFVVKDTGVGISGENLTKIFNQGFTTRIGGHGFGLHSSALATRDMKGSLTVESEGAGRGATFVLRLPAAPQGRA